MATVFTQVLDSRQLGTNSSSIPSNQNSDSSTLIETSTPNPNQRKNRRVYRTDDPITVANTEQNRGIRPIPVVQSVEIQTDNVESRTSSSESINETNISISLNETTHIQPTIQPHMQRFDSSSSDPGFHSQLDESKKRDIDLLNESARKYPLFFGATSFKNLLLKSCI